MASRAVASFLTLRLWRLLGTISLGLAIAAATRAGAAAKAEPDDPLRLTPEMRTWVGRAIPREGPPTLRLRRLTAALLTPAGLDLQEEDRTRTAAEAFASRRANCVGFAHLFVALAREAGIPAFFVLSDAEEGRRNSGDLRVLSLHMAAGFGPPEAMTVFDFAGVGSRDAVFRRISDAEAAAVLRSNRGAELLLKDRPDEALAEASAAAELAPGLHLVWSNLGVVRRRLGDFSGAEAAFRRAVALAPDSLAAWRNLALLLDASPQGRQGASPRHFDEIPLFFSRATN